MKMTVDAADSKATLIALLIQHWRDTGAMADVARALEAGGEEAVGVLGACLDHAVEVLDLLSTSLGRRERKAVMELLDRVESVSEGVFSEISGPCAIFVQNALPSGSTGRSRFMYSRDRLD
eukprot:SAG11_NODE_19139_length_473_cov_1.288770_1_plen_120_part_10